MLVTYSNLYLALDALFVLVVVVVVGVGLLKSVKYVFARNVS